MPRRSGPPGESAAETPPASSKPRRRPAPSPAQLRARLLAHVARQIERFDVALDTGAPPAGFDSAKVLRDLHGLKQMLDELKTAEGDGDGARDLPLDLAALRAGIARRYAAFAAAEPDGGLPDPAAAGRTPPAG